MKPRWLIAGTAALALGLLTLPMLRARGTEASLARPARDAARAEGATCDESGKAKLDFVVKDMNGNSVRLSDFKGKVIALNFWATWCGPCKAEMPMMAELEKQYANRGVAFIGASLDDAKTKSRIPDFLREHNVTCVLMPRNAAISAMLSQTPGWTSVYSDDVAIMFFKQ